MKFINLMVWRAVTAGSFLAAHGLTAAISNDGEDLLYAVPKVLQLQITIPPPQIESLRQDPKKYVSGTVREGSKVYTNVGVRLKGASSVQLLDKKPSLTIKFNEFATEQLFYGHERIQLNNAAHNPSYMSEAIGGEGFRTAGVPAAKVTFARIELNGRDAGLYVLAQAPNRGFLADYFGKTKGNFYEGDRNDVTDKLRLDSGNGPKGQVDLKSLANAAQESDPAQRLKKLGTVLDLERFVSMMAAEVITGHRTGYSLGRDNYRIYHDPAASRMVFIPEGLDELFGQAKGPLLPECKGLVARAVLETPEGLRLYRERMAKLLVTAFQTDVLHKQIGDLAGVIRPALAGDPNEAKSFEAAVAQLRDTIAQRGRFLEEELKKPAK